MLTWLGEPPAWWGWTLLAMGVVSGVVGVLYALSQHDLKRLLAYHSVENIGIIAMAMGVGLLGVHYQIPAMAALGYTAALLHVVNHAVFKSLLFLGAGSVLHATGTGEIDRLGGLLKRMPVTGATLPDRRGGDFRAAAAERLCERISPLSRRRGGAGQRGPQRYRLDVDERVGHWRAGADRRAGRGLFHQGLRHRVPRRAAQCRGGAAHEAGPAMRWPMVILAAAVRG